MASSSSEPQTKAEAGGSGGGAGSGGVGGDGGEPSEAAAAAAGLDQVFLHRGLKKAKKERGCTAKERISKMPPCAAGKRSSIYLCKWSCKQQKFRYVDSQGRENGCLKPPPPRASPSFSATRTACPTTITSRPWTDKTKSRRVRDLFLTPKIQASVPARCVRHGRPPLHVLQQGEICDNNYKHTSHRQRKSKMARVSPVVLVDEQVNQQRVQVNSDMSFRKSFPDKTKIRRRLGLGYQDQWVPWAIAEIVFEAG
ncbi:hypothetical protein RJ640_010820 [Escallonia rubra]|uniref:Uncharacterized protein n=1 Tax=Escallonia rubra TaxID=112253 RepID=A0AA88R4F0_9ASTE|nr:hypothetical protein RJ640_010820 [Escallonia rubra]